MKTHHIFILALLAAATAKAQDSSDMQRTALSFETFLNQVKEKNIDYISEKYNVDIADANLQAARIFPDPELSLSYSNNQDPTMKMGQSYEGELSYTFSLGNVRGARIHVSQAEKDLADASLADFFRNLKAESSIAFLDALKQQHNVALLKSTYEQMARLAQSDSTKLALGEGTETDALQSRVEAQTMYNDYLQSEAAYRNTLANLSILMGDKEMTGIESLSESPCEGENDYELGYLLQEAETNRTDLMMALHSKTLSEKNLRLVKANRATELGVSLGFAHNTIVENEIAPAPRHNSVSVGVSVPLKFSNRNKGEIHAAQAAIEQSEAELEAIRLQIRNEVVQAYNNYIVAQKIARNFSAQTIKDAETILKNKTFGYQQGETELLEVLDAQRTYNEVALSYYDALYNVDVAKIELERTSGFDLRSGRK